MVGSALFRYRIIDAITAGGMTHANWRRRAKNCVLRLLQVRQEKYCFSRVALRCLPTCHTGDLPRAVSKLVADGPEAGFEPTSGLPDTHLRSAIISFRFLGCAKGNS